MSLFGHSVHTTLHPTVFHGYGKKPPFFEGWYYKLVSAGEEHRYAVIPGVILGPSAHAFVQLLNGVSGEAAYYTYPLSAFQASTTELDVRIGANRFRTAQVHLDIGHPERPLCGDLRFNSIVPWPVTPALPGYMGWFAWIPWLETYHGVVSLDHTIEGTLTVDGAVVDFTGGRGYTEKDWGRSFPQAWVWLQSNHFPLPGTCLTASVAIIPWLRRSFRGFGVGLWLSGTLYRFATYTGAQIEQLAVSDRAVDCTMGDRRYRLELHAERATGGLLRGPTSRSMGLRVAETLSATVDVRLSSRSGRLLFEGRGRYAGLEVNGDLAALLAMS